MVEMQAQTTFTRRSHDRAKPFTTKTPLLKASLLPGPKKKPPMLRTTLRQFATSSAAKMSKSLKLSSGYVSIDLPLPLSICTKWEI